MREAVIVATARTPIGRAYKGSLIEERPDDLAGFAIRQALAQVPELDPAAIEDVMLGCGLTHAEASFNIARQAPACSQVSRTRSPPQPSTVGAPHHCRLFEWRFTLFPQAREMPTWRRAWNRSHARKESASILLTSTRASPTLRAMTTSTRFTSPWG